MVFETTSIHHEGDERSRTCPGHGYPAYTEEIHTIKYIPFANHEALEKWVTAAEQKPEYGYDRKPVYQLVEVCVLNPIVKTTVSFK
jgi:hypothetical protein